MSTESCSFEQRVLADVRQVILDGLLGHVEIGLGFHPRGLFPAPGPLDDHRGEHRHQRNAHQRRAPRQRSRRGAAGTSASFVRPGSRGKPPSARRPASARGPGPAREPSHSVLPALVGHRLQADRFERRRDRAVDALAAAGNPPRTPWRAPATSSSRETGLSR